MKNYFDIIEKKLKNELNIEKFEIIDNTLKHKSHKFFKPGKYHLHLKIESSYLKTMPRVNAHRLITKILKEDLKDKIHALEITIC